jgi:hypothetical protein
MSPRNAKPPVDDVLAQIRSCLDAATSRPGLVKASVYQTEGYLRGLQGQDWERPAVSKPSPDDAAAVFLHDVRSGSIALRGRLKEGSASSVKAFLRGFYETFPESSGKSFARALARLWARWKTEPAADRLETARRLGRLLKQEYEEGVAGELSAYLLDDRLHLRNVRDYLHMRGWLQGTIESLRRGDWARREQSAILASNFSSIVLRAMHNANPDYAAEAALKLPAMIRGLDRAIERLSSGDPESAHFLRKNRSTILTHALHSGYLDYGDKAIQELPSFLKKANEKIARLERSSPDSARNLREGLPAAVYRALTNGKIGSLV